MNQKVFKPILWMVSFVLVVGLACNIGGSAPTPTTQPAVEKTEAPVEKTEAPVVQTEAVPQATEAPTDTPEPESGAVGSIQDVKKAVIQIVAQGTFLDPEVGLVVNGAGAGSGFIIDPSGIAVTNNHVVTGAALLKVYVAGEDTPRNAKVLGVSECSDLAVIDIAGDGYDYLEWYDGPIEVGMDMYIAGFPLGDPEYTLNKGIVSKAKAGGETSWASVDSVLEYDATSNPGNSGGPVVTPDGKVLAVHYASYSSARQAFGISREIATSILEDLQAGRNVDTIGINGQAVSNEDGSITGIWVSSVQSGSPADKAGVASGDIITMLESLVLATDGSMSQYCDILRSHSPGDTLSLQILRWATSEVLEGQINGRALEVVAAGSSSSSSGSTTVGSAVVNANATASGDTFLATEFDDAENWYMFTVPENNDYSSSVDNSLVYIEVDDTDTTAYMLFDTEFPADVRVDTAVETVAGPNRNNISLICRATEDGWYEFSMNSGGYWYIWKYDDGRYTELNSGASMAINLQKAKNELTASCIGTELTLYVNQTKLGSIKDNRFKNGGQLGVSVTTFDIKGAGVEFDWFVASVP